MYSFALVGCSAAISSSYVCLNRLKSTTSASARDICPAKRRQRIRQSNPKHKEGCYVSAEHRQRHHLHRLQHHHEQRDDERDLGGFAYQERAHRPLPISS